MKNKDLEVGTECAFAQTTRTPCYGAQRAIVLDPRPIFENTRSDRWHNGYVLPGRRPNLVRPAWGRRTGRVAVGVECERTGWSEIDPATGEPWPEEELDNPRTIGRSREIATRTWWEPFAATLANLHHPWAEELERRADAERQSLLAREIQRVRDREAAERAEARRAEARQAEAERRKVEAARDEFFGTRLEPALVELEVPYQRYRGSGRVDMAIEDLDRLIHRLRGEVGR